MSLDLYLDGINTDELNIGSWQPPENQHKGYKDAVAYSVAKDREAREQRTEEARKTLYARLSPQQRALLDAVARQATGPELLNSQQGTNAHLEGLADTWAKHAGALLDTVITEPEPNTFSTSQAHTRLNDTSREWPRPPAKVDEEIGHRLTNINVEYRRANCAAHGYRVPIRSTASGRTWECGVKDQYRKANRRRAGEE